MKNKLLSKFLVVLAIVLGTGCGSQAQRQPKSNGDFALKNVHTGMYVRIKDANGANGTPIVAYSPVNWKCVTWHLQPTDTGAGYVLKNLFSGKTMEPSLAQSKTQIEMEEQPIRATSSRYVFVPAGDGRSFYIRSGESDLYLTPSDPKGETNSRIILTSKQPGDLQQWTLIEQHPTM